MFSLPAINNAGAARHISVFGGIDLRIAATSTDGLMSIWESAAAPGEGPPLHIHANEDELFYVLEGTFQFWCGEQSFIGAAGASAVLPRNVPHTYRNIGTTPGRLLAGAMPGGFEEFFLECERSGASDPATLAAIGAKYGLTFLPPAANTNEPPARHKVIASTHGLSAAERDSEITSG
jgi:mannose-6-phosphate isomerase-like protein (cupin superfamily)